MVEACSFIDTAALPQYKLPGCMHFNAVERELIAGTKGRPILALCGVGLHECIHTAAIAVSLLVQSACILVLQTEGGYYGLGLMSDYIHCPCMRWTTMTIQCHILERGN